MPLKFTIIIPLTKGLYTIIDATDSDLGARRWRANSSRGLYYAISAGTPYTLMHRAILERIIDRPLNKGEFVDHINGNPLDNRRVNLRLCTHAENSRNRKMTSLNTSGYKGVHFVKRRNLWCARIKVNGNRIVLGYRDTPEEAYELYKAAAIKYHGEFARF